MKKYFSLLVLFAGIQLGAQDLKNFKAYNPDENAKEAISKLVKQAKETNKHVLIQVGG